MQRLTFHPGDKDEWLKLRTKDLTSTEVGALFRIKDQAGQVKSVSPYATELEVYLAKLSGEVQEFEPAERMAWGLALQDAIAEKHGADQGWTIAKMTEYMRLPDHRIGASFDYRIVVGDTEGPDDGVLEVKNVDGLIFRDQWILSEEDAEIEAPLHIELQLQAQMLVSGLRWGYIAACVGGNRGVLLKREAHEQMQKTILEKAKAFWERVDKQNPPDFIFPDDSRVLIDYLSKVDGGTVETATETVSALAKRYCELGDQIKELTEVREATKAQILVAIGPTEKIIGDGFSISAGEIKGGVVESFFRKPFRMFRVNRKKAK